MTTNPVAERAAELIAAGEFPEALDLVLPLGPRAFEAAFYHGGDDDGLPVATHKAFWRFWVDWLLAQGHFRSVALLDCLQCFEGLLYTELTYADDTQWWLRNVQVLRALVLRDFLVGALQDFGEYYPGEAIPKVTADRLGAVAEELAGIELAPLAAEDSAARVTQGEYWPEELPLFWHELPADWRAERPFTNPYGDLRDPHEVVRTFKGWVAKRF